MAVAPEKLDNVLSYESEQNCARNHIRSHDPRIYVPCGHHGLHRPKVLARRQTGGAGPGIAGSLTLRQLKLAI